MPRHKGPEKRYVGFRVTKTTYKWLQAKAKGRAVPTYLAEQFENLAQADKQAEEAGE